MKNDKLVFRVVTVISAVVFLMVIILNRKLITPPKEYPSFINRLPLFNAIINATCSLLLLFSFKAIRKKDVDTHKKLNFVAFVLSSLFLVSYVLFHFFAPETHFGGQGFIKYAYYFILITHIILAAIVLPLVLLSFYYGINNEVLKHRKLVRYSFPIWLYVTITGVLVYLLISPYYAFNI